ncbi:MAG TPA: DUF2007 domain-containing protein [Fimbriiglobus sp.]|jgi:hypothetical protein
MSRRLVTVAVYDLPPLAHIARDALEAAGIKATVADGQMVGMDWLLSTAIGGVKVQVWEEDAERAVDVLESVHRKSESPEGDEPPPDDDADYGVSEEPTEADFADEPESPDPSSVRVPTNVEDETPRTGEMTERDRLARRAFFVAWLGLPILPIAAYSFYLCLNSTFGPGEISARGKFELCVAWCTTCLGFFFSMLFCLNFA